MAESKISKYLSKMEKTILFDVSDNTNLKLTSTTTIAGLGSLADWDIIQFICRANTEDDTYAFQIINSSGLKYAPYTMFSGGIYPYTSVIKVWGGDNNVLGIACVPNNPNWVLGIISIIGYKFK